MYYDYLMISFYYICLELVLIIFNFLKINTLINNIMKDSKDLIYFASESVGEGHPDKLCDQVSDAILDACLKINPDAKVAMETATKTGMVSIFRFIILISFTFLGCAPW